MSARLVSLDGMGDIPLDRPVLLVGRDSHCDARLDSLRISRRHCCLAIRCDGITVRDLGSVNGTWINGRRSESGPLRAGDELAIGHLRFRLQTDPAEDNPWTLSDPPRIMGRADHMSAV
jgi:pSer/pThr/pTyr-binding forkhead associated (FHA) protein